MKRMFVVLVFGFILLWGCSNRTDPNVVRMHLLTGQGVGAAIGTIRVSETTYGVLLSPDLQNLPPGVHGFHVHTEDDCGPAEKEGQMVPGLAAGGHYDPAGTNSHQGPYGHGHLGDLPALTVVADGAANLPLLAPRLKLTDIRGRALIIHAGGDNYSDQPHMGGGGARIACGVVATAAEGDGR